MIRDALLLREITQIPARTVSCEGMDGSRPCKFFAEVRLDRSQLCRMHAVERLNLYHQADVEAVHRVARGEA
jgi:hypothetical protein